jgi:hypothetical protein
MSRNAIVVGLTAVLVLIPGLSAARVTRLLVTQVDSPTFEGTRFGPVGPYEWLIGSAEGELDPGDPRNTVIVNLDKAPRNARGLVEYRVDVQILKPVDTRRGNGRILYDVLNRGDKRSLNSRINGGPNLNDLRLAAHVGTGLLMNRGYTMVWSGWQGDVEPGSGRMLAHFPIARNPDGTPVTGVNRDEFIFGHTRNPITARLSYPAAVLDPSRARLTVRQHERDPRQTPDSLTWSYVSPTEIRIERPAGFDAGAIYELVYPAKDPTVMGIAFAAVRDVVSFLRYESKDQAGTANPLGGAIQKAMAMGISQSGRFLRDMLYQGFHVDEQGRIVFDGMMPIVSGSRRTQVNRAFSVPGRFSRQHEDHTQADHQFPFAYQVLRDPITGRSDGILARCLANGTCPKIFHVDTDSEIFQGAASLIVTDPAGAPLSLPDNVRAYLMAGHEHVVAESPRYGNCQQLTNPLNYAPHMRALIVALDEWITRGTPPPDSRFPSLSEGTLVPPNHPRAAFPAIPGFRYFGLAKQARVLDFSVEPPAEGAVYPVFVGAKDADGNNVSGVRHPFLEVPTATYAGWNLRKAGFGENALCSVNGSYIPFAKTKGERAASGDQRLSIEERYPTHDGYASRIRQAADRLVHARLLLAEDAERLIKEAEASAIGR